MFYFGKMKILKIIAFFLTILNVGFGFKITCPEENKLDPCTCKMMAYGLHVICADFNDTQALVKALNNLRGYEVKNVVLHNLILEEILPKDLFNGLDINEISVEKSNLVFSQPAFKGLDESLQILNIAQHSIIKSSEKFTIARLTNLTELSMKKNPLYIVKDNWLNGKVPSVQKIILDADDIAKIENKAFADLTRLQSISIAGNRIKHVERSMFPNPAENLTSIDLSDNEIEHLPEDFFSNMPAIEEIVLSGNDLTGLPKKTWKPIWKQLKTVLLFNNKLICDRSMNWIAKVGWPEQMEAKCVAPSALVGKDLRDVYDTVT